eukprot:TRINITY_DN7111_c0_g1_i1.p1 TRINITY_DN7111_c0_g1~~TRINITY_DN7111_c0_g1_i1.p1  ORF type:complete len:285 (+),score=51.78 TRINITY_DN7111_c0_g1_i1:90-944(+)
MPQPVRKESSSIAGVALEASCDGAATTSKDLLGEQPGCGSCGSSEAGDDQLASTDLSANLSEPSGEEQGPVRSPRSPSRRSPRSPNRRPRLNDIHTRNTSSFFMLEEVTGGPSAQYLVSHFQDHVEPALREMASMIGKQWLARLAGRAGMNPDGGDVSPLARTMSGSPMFQEALTKGFAIECLGVVQAPPSPLILFKFRHVCQFLGVFTGEDGRTWKGQGQMLDTMGFCHVIRNPMTGELGKMEVYFNHVDLMKSMLDPMLANPGYCPMSGKMGVCPVTRFCNF